MRGWPNVEVTIVEAQTGVSGYMAWVAAVAVWAMAWGVAVGVVGVSVLMAYLRYANTRARPCTAPDMMKGKTVLVTANDDGGVGEEVARDLAGRGARVMLATPTLARAERQAAAITAFTGNEEVKGLQLDTSSMASVKHFGKQFITTEKRLDVLVLAAGRGAPPNRTETEEGLEVTLATNHLGHFLLVNLLLGVLMTSSPSRVVVKASSAHYMLSSITPKDLNFKKGDYGALAAYALSQLCNTFMATNLTILTAGSGLVVNSACPGLVLSEPYLSPGGVMAWLYDVGLSFVGRTPEQGAQTLIHAAVSRQGASISGAFFTDCEETKLTGLAADAGLAKKVWEVSEGLVGLLPQDHE